MLKTDRPQTRGVISFADETEGHKGIVYQATNFYQIGKTGKATFFIDADGRLRHPRQNGHNVTPEEAKEYGWMPVKRESKNRYLYILAPTKIERKRLTKSCNYNLSERGNDEQ